MNSKISIHGAYFGVNFGDVLLISIVKGWIKNIFPESEINMPLLSKKHYDLYKPDTIGILNFIKSDTIIFTGGGYFGEPKANREFWGLRNFIQHGIIGLISVLFNKNIVIIGVGAGPITNLLFRKTVVTICKKSKLLTVRDKESKQYLVDYGVSKEKITITADIALNLSHEDFENEQFFPNSHKTIGIHISGINDEEQFLEIIKKTAEIAQFEKYNLVFFKDSKTIKNRMPKILDLIKSYETKFKNSIHFYDFESINKVITIIKNLDFVITTKLHIGIIATRFNIPVLSLYKHPKTIRYYKQIKWKYCFPFYKFNLHLLKEILNQFLQSNVQQQIVPEEIYFASKMNKVLLEKELNKLLR